MKGFGRGPRRGAGARPSKAARPSVVTRSPEAALGRATRGLVGPSRRGGAGSDRARPRIGIPTPLRMTGRLVTRARAAALLGMLSCGFLLTFVTGPTAFARTRTDLPDLTWTDAELVTATLGLAPGGNVFRLDTDPLEAALGGLPAVERADVSVSLPDAAIVVRIEERVPVLAWQIDQTRFIADRDGLVFATVDVAAPLPGGVAVVLDRRVGSAGTLAIGGHLDAVDLDVATRLGSLTPTDIGSSAPRLEVAVTEDDGFVVRVAGGWTAVFGFYSPATRSTEMIPGQVRLLRSLLDGREATLTRIILASATDGTYVPRPTPKATTR